MITLFKIFEKTISTEINNDGLSEELLDNLIDGISLITFKGKKKDDKKHINYKQLKIKKLDSSINKREINQNTSTTKSTIDLVLNNNDTIDAIYTKIEKFDNLIDNCIEIKINDKVVFHRDSDDYNEKEFIKNIVTQYKKYIETKCKIK